MQTARNFWVRADRPPSNILRNAGLVATIALPPSLALLAYHQNKYDHEESAARAMREAERGTAWDERVVQTFVDLVNAHSSSDKNQKVPIPKFERAQKAAAELMGRKIELDAAMIACHENSGNMMSVKDSAEAQLVLSVRRIWRT